MRRETFRLLTEELIRARKKYPGAPRLSTFEHFERQLKEALREFEQGRGNTINVFTNALTLAVLAIRFAEDGVRDFRYAQKFELES